MKQTGPTKEISIPSIAQSDKLNDICYDIRGPVLEIAKQLEEEGHQILKLNIN